MHKFALLVYLLLPSVLVGMVCVADRGASALLFSPILVLLPITQGIVFVACFAITFPIAMTLAAGILITLYIYILMSPTFESTKAKATIAIVAGVIHSFFVPWSIDSLGWYA